jgi:hypothetical protein
MNMSGKAIITLAKLSDGYGEARFEASHPRGFVTTVVTADAT